MSAITTHVLDTARGCPAEGMPIVLEILQDGEFSEVTRAVTNSDGRVTDFTPTGSLEAATYRITFETGVYFQKLNIQGFYPQVQVDFVITQPNEHHHVPLLISPFGFSTYRGS